MTITDSGDVDGDGDVDFAGYLEPVFGGPTIALFEARAGAFVTRRLAGAEYASDVTLFDIDLDGDEDVIMTDITGRFAFVENPN